MASPKTGGRKGLQVRILCFLQVGSPSPPNFAALRLAGRTTVRFENLDRRSPPKCTKADVVGPSLSAKQKADSSESAFIFDPRTCFWTMGNIDRYPFDEVRVQQSLRHPLLGVQPDNHQTGLCKILDNLSFVQLFHSWIASLKQESPRTPTPQFSSELEEESSQAPSESVFDILRSLSFIESPIEIFRLCYF